MTTYRLYWTSEDKQASIAGRDYSSRDEAERGIETEHATMLREGTDDDAEWIEAGQWSVEEEG